MTVHKLHSAPKKSNCFMLFIVVYSNVCLMKTRFVQISIHLIVKSSKGVHKITTTEIQLILDGTPVE